MKRVLEALGGHYGSEWLVKSYDGWSLVFFSGSSIEYAKPTVSFSGVSYMSCPFEISHPSFREATVAERQEVGANVPLESGDMVIAIEAETMAGLARKVFFLVASGAALFR